LKHILTAFLGVSNDSDCFRRIGIEVIKDREIVDDSGSETYLSYLIVMERIEFVILCIMVELITLIQKMMEI
jgi:hypothetical protein